MKYKKGELDMDFNLKDKVVLVTGSSRGIGKAIALGFLKERAKVVVNGRTEETLKQTVGELTKAFGSENVLPLKADLTDDRQIKESIKEIVKRWQRIDILVANIGSGKGKLGLQPERKDWEDTLNTNLLGCISTIKEVAPHMIEQNGGSIVLISSITGYEALPAPIPYSVAKAGLILVCKNLSRYFASHNIRINAVAPGNIFVKEGTWDRKIKEDPRGVKQYIETEVPMKRFGKPEEIADAVLFLASERASFITGTCLIVDGGQTRSFV
jgi:3-oxoacyl-[acyl-carrier protein] reductase